MEFLFLCLLLSVPDCICSNILRVYLSKVIQPSDNIVAGEAAFREQWNCLLTSQ